MTGEQLRSLREARGLTRQQLADFLGDCSHSTVNKWERDISPVPEWVAEKMLREVNITLPLADLHLLLNEAISRDVSFPQILSEAIRDYIAKRSKGSIVPLGTVLVEESAEHTAKPPTKPPGKRKAG